VVLDIAPDDPSAPDIERLLTIHLEFADEVTPSGHVHALGQSGLEAGDVTLVSARQTHELLGIGALKELDPLHGELKSMHTAEQARGRGVGAAIVTHLLSIARERGYRRVSLETGTMEAFRPARLLYERFGFRRCEPFGDYTDNPHSVCMTIELAPFTP
jgi:putative acetyltransferase